MATEEICIRRLDNMDGYIIITRGERGMGFNPKVIPRRYIAEAVLSEIEEVLKRKNPLIIKL